MKGFSISQEQIVSVVAGLAADELSLRFRRHVDFLTVAAWDRETPVGAGGIGLVSAAERAACARRIESFFGLEPGAAPVADAMTIEDWARAAHDQAQAGLVAFSFTAAGRDSAVESSVHAAADIFCDAAATANLLYGRRRVVSLVSPHGLMGFVSTILLANLQGVPLLNARPLAPEALIEALSFGDVVVATPTLWRYLVREGVVAPSNAIAVSFGEPLTIELAADLRKAGFGALRELYGSTEIGVVAWRDQPSEPFNLFDHWSRQDGCLRRRAAASGQWVDAPAMDAIEWTGERSFLLGGRLDGAVQIGAVNVFPDRVAAAIAGHRMVAACRVDVMRRGGETRLVAQITLKPGFSPHESVAREIDIWSRSRLRPQERPRIYNYCGETR